MRIVIGLLYSLYLMMSAAFAAGPDLATFKTQLLSVASPSPPVVLDDFRINTDILRVESKASFPDQIGAHKANLLLLKKLDTARKSGWNSDIAEVVRASQTFADSMIPFVLTYTLMSDRSKRLADQGYKLKNIFDAANLKQVSAVATDPNDSGWRASACNQNGQCTDVDPIVALFMIVINAVVDEFRKDKPFGENNELTKVVAAVAAFLEKPAGGDNSVFVKVREIFIPQDDSGEIAKILRDPIRRPIEIVEDALKALNNDNGEIARLLTRPGDLIPAGWRPTDNGDIARAIRDPVNCTVGKLFGRCG